MNRHHRITARLAPIPLLRHTAIAAALMAVTLTSSAAPPVITPTEAPTARKGELKSAPGRLLVEPRAGLSEAEFEKILKPHGGRKAGRISGTNVHIIELPPNASEKAVAALLARNPHLKFAEPDYQLPSQLQVNDEYFGYAWHLPHIQAPAAWDTSTGSNVTIAILDSGVNVGHPDLAGKIIPGWNFYDNNADTSDVYGHGTLVAGAAAASSNNVIGVASVAGGARIMPMRVTDTAGMGYISKMAQAITWAADRGARVANLSFEAAGAFSTVQSAAQYMKNKGGLVVTAAGNLGTQEVHAASDATIVVSATDGNDARTSWSSYGAFIDIAAPGLGIWTTHSGGGYSAASGTSFSSPVTAGVAALVMAANPALSASSVEQLLFSTAVDVGAAGFDVEFGRGRVNAAAAVLAAATAVARDTTAPSVSIASPASGSVVKGLVPIDVSASDDVGVSRVELLVNGSPLGTDVSSPYGFSWDSTQVADGSVNLVAYAYDAAGNYASRTQTVKVTNSADLIAPAVTIGRPLANSTVSGNVSIQASGSDNIAVTSMKLFIDGALKATASSGSLSSTWNAKKAARGAHAIRVEASDAAGNVAAQEIQVYR